MQGCGGEASVCGRGWQGHRGGGSNILQAVGKHLVGLRLAVPAS